MATTDKLKGEIAKREQGAPAKQQHPLATIKDLFDRNKDEIQRAIPNHLSADRLARIAYTVVKQNRQLAECTPESLLGALMTCAQLGLEPGPTGEAYLVPYGNQVTFIPGYRGLIKLAWQSGQLASIKAETVHRNDVFDVSFGLHPDVKHVPPPGWPADDIDRGDAVAYYATATLKNGGGVFHVMSRSDVEQIRARSRARNSGPWQTDYDAMARKTVIRQLIKYLPLSAEVATALAYDESVRTDTSSELVDVAPEFIDAEVVEEQPQQPAEAGATWPEAAKPGSGVQP